MLSTTIQPRVNGSSEATIEAGGPEFPMRRRKSFPLSGWSDSTTGPASLRLTGSSKPLLEPDAFIHSDPPLSGEKPVVTFELDNRATLTGNLPGMTAESIRGRPSPRLSCPGSRGVGGVTRTAGKRSGKARPRLNPERQSIQQRLRAHRHRAGRRVYSEPHALRFPRAFAEASLVRSRQHRQLQPDSHGVRGFRRRHPGFLSSAGRRAGG